MTTVDFDELRKTWKCATCRVSFAFRHGDPRFSRFCVYCAAKIQEHGKKPELREVARQDTVASWAVITDDWLDRGGDLPEPVTKQDAAEFDAWMQGGPSTPGALRFARSRSELRSVSQAKFERPKD